MAARGKVRGARAPGGVGPPGQDPSPFIHIEVHTAGVWDVRVKKARMLCLVSTSEAPGELAPCSHT